MCRVQGLVVQRGPNGHRARVRREAGIQVAKSPKITRHRKQHVGLSSGLAIYAGRLLQGASHDARSIQQIPEWTAVRAGYCVDCLSQLMASRHGASAPRLMRYRAPLVVLAAR